MQYFGGKGRLGSRIAEYNVDSPTARQDNNRRVEKLFTLKGEE
jgi:hypothetical protein